MLSVGWHLSHFLFFFSFFSFCSFFSFFFSFSFRSTCHFRSVIIGIIVLPLGLGGRGRHPGRPLSAGV